jgi:hypothetical protein
MLLEVFNFIWLVLIPDMFHKFLELIAAPFIYPEMFWILTPVIITWIIIELYFARYIRENMEYHTALDNSLFLFFVSVDLVRRLVFDNILFDDWLRTIIVLILLGLAFVLAYLDFFHLIRKDIGFRFSSKFVISFISYVSIILIYSDILSVHTFYNYGVTLIGVLLLYVLFKFIANSIQVYEPKQIDEVGEVLRNVEKELTEAAHKVKETERELKKKST